jgi:hypothetical protein
LKMFNAMWLGCSKSVVCWCNYLNHVKHWQIYTLAKGLAIQTVWWFQTCERNRNKKTRNGIIISVVCRPAPFSMICLRMPKPAVQIEVERTKTLLVILPPTDLVGKDASFIIVYKLLTCTCVYEGRRPVCISSWFIYGTQLEHVQPCHNQLPALLLLDFNEYLYW